ncbi:MAG: hypothetical protein WAL71_02700 [Terriglobales bacterium]
MPTPTRVEMRWGAEAFEIEAAQTSVSAFCLLVAAARGRFA